MFESGSQMRAALFLYYSCQQQGLVLGKVQDDNLVMYLDGTVEVSQTLLRESQKR